MIGTLATDNWITFLFIFLFGILVLANYLFEKRFLRFRALFQSKQYFTTYISITTVFHPFNILMLFFQIGCYAFLALKILLYYKEETVANQFTVFIKIALGILVVYFARYIYGKIFAVIFKLVREQEGLSFVKMTHLSKVTLFIFPFLIVFHFFEFKNGLLFVFLASYVLVFLLIKYANILRQNQKFIFKRLFYFILYLCILEIAPLLLVYKVLISRM